MSVMPAAANFTALYLSGANTSSSSFHRNPTDLPCLPLGNKIFLDNLYFIPAHVGSNDRDQEILGLLFHSTRNEDPG